MVAKFYYHILSPFVLLLPIQQMCRNPNLGLATKARGWKVVGQEEDPRVTSHAPMSAKSVRA